MRWKAMEIKTIALFAVVVAAVFRQMFAEV